jgi:hypothetical protein
MLASSVVLFQPEGNSAMQAVTPVMSQRFLNGRAVRFLVLLAVIATMLAASVSGMFAAENTAIGPDITRLNLDRDGADIPGPVPDARFQMLGDPRIVPSGGKYLAGPYDVAGGNEGLTYFPPRTVERATSIYDRCVVDMAMYLTIECW